MKAEPEALRGVMSTFFRYSLKAAAGKTSGSSAQNLEESGALCGRDSRVLAHALWFTDSVGCRFRLTLPGLWRSSFQKTKKHQRKATNFTHSLIWPFRGLHEASPRWRGMCTFKCSECHPAQQLHSDGGSSAEQPKGRISRPWWPMWHN